MNLLGFRAPNRDLNFGDGEVCFEQHVGGLSGHGLPAINYRQERKPTPERSPATPGRDKRCCKKYTSTGPTKLRDP